MVASRTLTTSNAAKDEEQQEHEWEYKMAQPLGETGGRFLTKLNTLSPYGPAIALLGIYPKELKTCTGRSMAALFIIAKTRKPLWCPSVGEWINTL